MSAEHAARSRDWYLSKVEIEKPRTYTISIPTVVDVPQEERERKYNREYNRERYRKFARERPFVAWDGEGINLEGPDKPQAYCLFGASTGDYISSKKGLSSKQCFQTILRVKYKNPDAIHVGFAFSYDVEMMLRDLPHNMIWAIVDGHPRWWGRYRIQYRHKKWLQLTGPYRGQVISVRIYDVWSFFGCTLIKAIETFIPDTNEHTKRRIREGKRARGDFTVDQLDTVMIPYWQEELQCTVHLCTKLRSLLHKAGLFPTMWHGPAALANYLNKKHNIAAHMNRDAPEHVKDAMQYAYAAGRVENFMVGRACRPVYKYDRNSAYPSAITHVPSLANNKWVGYQFPDWRTNAETDPDKLSIASFGMYYVDYKFTMYYEDVGRAYREPQPFFHRTKQGNVMFPHATYRWMWGTELKAALHLNRHSLDRPVIRVYRAIELENYTGERPYEFVEDMYRKRVEMKRLGQQEELAIKLGLNSLYGKMAQQKGYSARVADERPWYKQMPWHQFDWAGFVTANNRARMYEAAIIAGNRGILISVETDAIFTTERMPEFEPATDALGGWSMERYDDFIALQSGVYLTLKNGQWSLKYRGFDEDSVTVDDVLKYLETTSLYHLDPEEYEQNALAGLTTRFMGAKLAKARTFGMEDDWRVWKRETKKIVVGNAGKRIHIPEFCRACQHGRYYASDCMHDMSIKRYVDQENESYATPLPWRTVTRQADVWLPEEEENDFELDGIQL